MTVEQYLNKYHDIWAWQDDYSRQWVKLRKYVSGCDSNDPESPWNARKPIINGLISENPKQYNWSTDEFLVDGAYYVDAVAVCRAFSGKGSPWEINDAIWLAHRYGRILNLEKKRAGAKTIQGYTDAYLGMDCNGFVGNFFGIDPNTSIRDYALSRRKSVNEIQVNDVVVWYRSWKKSKRYGHIGVVARIDSRSESDFRYQLIDWGSGPQENHKRTLTVKLLKDTTGDKDELKIKDSVYYQEKEGGYYASVFFCPPPCVPKPKP